MAHCELVRYLASILEPGKDRLAIVCSSTSTLQPNVIAPLSRMNAQKLKVALDSITTSSRESQTLETASLLRLAEDLLVKQLAPGNSEARIGPTYGHICFLTHRVDASFSSFSLDPKLTLHLISSSALPYKHEQWPHTNGWKLRCLTGKQPKLPSPTKSDFEAYDVSLGLQKLVYHARTGQRLGVLKSVDWELGPGKDTIVVSKLPKFLTCFWIALRHCLQRILKVNSGTDIA